MKEMKLEKIKLFPLQLEAEKKTDTKEETRVQRVYGDSQQAIENKWYGYNGAGHGAKQCQFDNTNKWFCYVCQTIKYHKSKEYPQVSSGSDDNNNKSKSTHESVAKNKSKSEQKGFKNKQKTKLNQASGNKESKNKNESGKSFFVKSLLES